MVLSGYSGGWAFWQSALMTGPLTGLRAPVAWAIRAIGAGVGPRSNGASRHGSAGRILNGGLAGGRAAGGRDRRESVRSAGTPAHRLAPPPGTDSAAQPHLNDPRGDEDRRSRRPEQARPGQPHEGRSGDRKLAERPEKVSG